MLSKQEVFDKVARHLILQNARSVKKYSDRGGVMSPPACAYRGEGGLKCAAGCVIPDEVYYPEMEGTLFSYIYATEESLQELFDFRTSVLVGRLQIMHDDAVCGPEYWPDRLKNLANEYKLNPQIVDDALKDRNANVQ